MERKTKNGGKWEIHTVGLENDKKTENHGKWETHTVGHGIWQEHWKTCKLRNKHSFAWNMAGKMQKKMEKLKCTL